MSYSLISRTEPTARKEYNCIWCPEKILRGEKHVHEISKADEFQNHRWHLECWSASQEYFSENPGEDMLYPHESKRGSAYGPA